MPRPTFIGVPTSAVLYRTPSRWRYAIVDHRGGILDGALPRTAPDSTAEQAKADFVSSLSAAEGIPWSAAWTASDPAPSSTSDATDWWEADLRPGSD